MRIIALTGPKTCGKDTAASGLLKQNVQVSRKYTPLFMRTPFAQPMKKICHDVFGWSWADMDDPVFKETPLLEWPQIEPRWVMMDIANWFRDKYGPDVWVNALARHLLDLEQRDRHGAYVITDLRFPNEIAWLKSLPDALIVYVERQEAEEALAKARASLDPKALNPSESFYREMKAGAHHVLKNDGTTYQLQHQLMDLVRHKWDHWTYWGMGPLTRPYGDKA